MGAFKNKVLEIVQAIPKGCVVSYGQLALMAGIPRAARAVGQILRNFGETVPWWRVMNNKGYLSIKNGRFAKDVQKGLLELDGVFVNDKYILDIEKYRWRPTEAKLNKFELDSELIEMFLEKYLF